MSALPIAYGLVCYGAFLFTFLYTIGFVGNLLVPLSVDAGGAESPYLAALAVNSGLLGLFALQHSGMARQGFKRLWTRIIPERLERSTYVLASSAVLLVLFWQWRPMTGIVWDVEHAVTRTALWGLFAAGWGLVLLATFVIDHLQLFGLRQVCRHRETPALATSFKQPFLYRLVRHPLYVGFLIAFWAIPTMTHGHLLFAAVTTGYVLAAIQLEERDLLRAHPEYAAYRSRVPMLIPGLRRRRR